MFSPIITTVVQASFTRPADTTAYAAGDAMSATAAAALELNVSRGKDMGALIIQALLISSVAGTPEDIDVYLFDTAPAAANIADNAAAAISDAEILRLQGVIAFDADDARVIGANQVWRKEITLAVRPLGTDSRKIYAVLVARGAYVPASGEVFTLVLGVAQD
jgi:adenine-specific DNA methylase